MAVILVIDDEEMVRATIRMRLEQGGHEVVEAGDGNEGLATLERYAVDLVVTDIIMPEKEGIETIRAIRQRRPELAIVAISGGGRTSTLDFLGAAKKLGADHALRKPFTGAELLQVVDAALQRGRG
ncbi:MAG: transcriptional regulator [Alphaproteobacteria bacterium]|nr:MAG: transcriptional regulator [Alphaproteobacteria bacterium]